MDNKSIVKTLKLFAQLLELHEENPFKIKNFTNANFKLSKYAEPLFSKSLEDLAKIEERIRTSFKSEIEEYKEQVNKLKPYLEEAEKRISCLEEGRVFEKKSKKKSKFKFFNQI